MAATYKIDAPIHVKVGDKSTILIAGGYVSDAGQGVIKGVATEKGVPVSRRVMLYDRYSGRLTRTTYSNENGEYSFSNINPNLKYFITSIDENNDGTQYNAVTQDLIIASEVVS